jgi:hypothetical protein
VQDILIDFWFSRGFFFIQDDFCIKLSPFFVKNEYKNLKIFKDEQEKEKEREKAEYLKKKKFWKKKLK